MSLDRGPGAAPTFKAKKQRLPRLDTVGEAHHAANRASVNYSRPMSPQNSSPMNSPVDGNRGRNHPPQSKVALGPPITETEEKAGLLQDAAVRPHHKKKKIVAEKFPEDSPGSTAMTNSSPKNLRSSITTSSLVGVGPKANEGTALASPKMKKKKKKVVKEEKPQDGEGDEGFGTSYPSDTDSVTSEVSSTTDRPRSFNTRAAGLLAKQPSIVREDREGEERAESKLPEAKINLQPLHEDKTSASPANISKPMSEERQHDRSASQHQVTQKKGPTSLNATGVNRPLSLSPARAAHFSNQPLYETPDGLKHQPPPRSVSPAKSALKNSPSRGHSPIINRSRGSAFSEASDTASGMSDDGSKSARRTKKSVRVSFDEDSVMRGQTLSDVHTDSPGASSPQSKSNARSWLDLIRDKRPVSDDPSQDLEDTNIKPTPTLPSFGSVRSRNDKAALEGDHEAVLDDADVQNATTSSLKSSADHNVGAVISQDAAIKGGERMQPQAQRSHDITNPPYPTPTEGSDYLSNEVGVAQATRLPNPLVLPATARTSSTESATARIGTSKEPNLGQTQTEEYAPVPSIAVMPATPGAEESLATRDEWLGMSEKLPGPAEMPKRVQHSAVTASQSASPEPSIAASAVDHSPRARSPSIPTTPVITPATVGIAEPEPAAAAAQHDANSPHVGEVADTLRTQIESQSGEESDDHDSIYSDAAEDQLDVEGDGFGSINAIVESPATPNFGAIGKSPPASPTPKAKEDVIQRQKPERNPSEMSEPGSDEGWDRAQAYWSGLSQTRKQQLEQAAVPGAVDEPIIPDRTMRSKDSVVKTQKGVTKTTVSPGQISAPLLPRSGQTERNGITKSPSPKAPKTSQAMHKPQQIMNSESHLRGTMRNGKYSKPAVKETTGRQSVQIGPPENRGTLQKKARPVSAVSMVEYHKPQAASKANHARAVSATSTPTSLAPLGKQAQETTNTAKSKLSRTKSNGSDSDSSFKRLRSPTADASKYQMKRTMRGPSGHNAGSSEPTNRAISTSERVISPVGSTARRPFSSIGPGGGAGMRSSMRDSIDSGKPARMSLRNSIDSTKASRTKSPSRFGFALGSKSKPVESKPVSNPASSYGSRFGDSSDDEDVLPTMNSSRFADSSDEDEPALAPVRGIPRRIDEGDSTDLEDSSAETTHGLTSGKSNSTGPTTASAPSTKPEGLALASGSLRTAPGEAGPTPIVGSGLQSKKATEKEKKKRLLLGALSSRKRDDPSRRPKADIENGSLRDIPERPVGNNARALEFKRAADSALPVVGGAFQASTAPSTPKSPKLQRRNTPKKLTTANETPWPLGRGYNGTPISTPSPRPRTSDGAGSKISGARPDIGSRRVTVQSAVVPNSASVATNGSSGKKKRFPMLRKAFGLHN